MKEILKIYKLNNTVFSFDELAIILKETNKELLKRRINYYVKQGQLIQLRKGIYTKDKNYNKFELALKIYSPSYISFETVLQKKGIVFQFYGQIFVASYLSREINIKEQKYVYRKLKNSILINNKGVNIKKYYSIASLERAFLDTIYLNKNYYFDNLTPLNWEKVYDILKNYNDNKNFKLMVNKYYKIHKNS
ncbi:MAG: hypothetical protein GF335_00465 [Candidatus Moranbacteria bacterium]|nr:hypothetical protein [Candidatus Moranbacteria bacterium]